MFQRLSFGVLLIIAIISIVSVVVFDGNIMMDGAVYIRLADLFNETKSFYYDNLNSNGYFTDWPPLYILMTAAIKKVTQIETWVASKAVNLVFLGLFLLYTIKYYKMNRWFIGFVFTTSTFIYIFSATLSEAVFVSMICIHVIELKKWWNSQKVNYTFLILTGVGCIYTRYAGLVLFPTYLCILFFKWRLEKKIDKKLVFSFLLVFTFFLTLLVINLFHNAPIMGNRSPNVTPTWAIMKEFFTAFVNQFEVYKSVGIIQWKFFTIPFVLVSIYFIYVKYSKSKIKDSSIFIWFVIAGFYLILLFFSKHSMALNWIDERLLFPFTFFMWMALFDMIQKVKVSKYIVISLVFISLVYNSYLFIINYTKVVNGKRELVSNYKTKLNSLKSKYSNIPSKSSVLLADHEIVFLRPDIQVRYPYKFPYVSSNETFQEFKDRFAQKELLYMNIISKERAHIYDESYVLEMQKYGFSNQIIPIK